MATNMCWTLPDGSIAFRESILLRGLVFETDETMRSAPTACRSRSSIRGVTPSGDAAETFAIDQGDGALEEPGRQGRRRPIPRQLIISPGRHVPRAMRPQIDRLLAAGPRRDGAAAVRAGTLDTVASLDVDGPQGQEDVELHFCKGSARRRSRCWVENGKFFGALGRPGAAAGRL